MDMIRSIGKWSGESVESVLKKKKKTTVGRTQQVGKGHIWALRGSDVGTKGQRCQCHSAILLKEAQVELTHLHF